MSTQGSVAWIFPGQGSQFVGMGRPLFDAHPTARKLLDDASAILGRDLASIMFEGPEDELRQTVNTQPAILVHSLAVDSALRAAGRTPRMVAGHSLGEYSALCSAGVLGFESVLKLVKFRSELMQAAGTTRPGAMAAIIGLDDNRLRELCDATGGECVIANFNAPGQTVISGATGAVEQVVAQAKAAGAKRALPLPVSGAFHSPLMEEPAAKLAELIAQTEFRDAAVPVVTNIDAQPHTAAASLRRNLVAQMTGSVRWTDTVRKLVDLGAASMLEVGPGKVLAGLGKRIAPDIAVASIGTPDDLAAAG